MRYHILLRYNHFAASVQDREMTVRQELPYYSLQSCIDDYADKLAFQEDVADPEFLRHVDRFGTHGSAWVVAVCLKA